MTTPPGWYPDPTHQGPGPAPERWWDGSAWTDHRRDAQGVHSAPTMIGTPGPAAPAYPPAQPGYQPGQAPGQTPGQAPGYAPGGYPGYPPEPGPASRGRNAKIAAVAAATVVVTAAIVGGVVLLADDGDKDDKAKPGPSATGPAPDSSGAPSEDPTDEPSTDAPTTAPTDDPRAAEDLASGVSLPVPEGWRAAGTDPSSGAGMTTVDSYPCPAAPESNCVPGGVFSFPASGYKAKTAEGIAKEDIAQNAEASYGTDPVSKKKSYGGITSHKQLKSEAVTVAGQKGYLVRWKVDTKKGADGYVQSLAFPSPTVPGATVLVRFGFDVSDQAPTLADMDAIVKGIKPLSDPGDNEAV